MITLGSGHVRDLTTPRYKCVVDDSGKYLIDTHSYPIVKNKYNGENVEELNKDYHNQVISALGYDSSLELAAELSVINRSSW